MKHYIATLIILLATALAYGHIQHGHRTAARLPRPKPRCSISPRTIGGYTQWGEDEPIDDALKEELQTSTILMRTYRSQTGRPVQLTVVYAGSTRRSMHFPEVCLVGQGWEVREQSTMPVGFQFSATPPRARPGNPKRRHSLLVQDRRRIHGQFLRQFLALGPHAAHPGPRYLRHDTH